MFGGWVGGGGGDACTRGVWVVLGAMCRACKCGGDAGVARAHKLACACAGPHAAVAHRPAAAAAACPAGLTLDADVHERRVGVHVALDAAAAHLRHQLQRAAQLLLAPTLQRQGHAVAGWAGWGVEPGWRQQVHEECNAACAAQGRVLPLWWRARWCPLTSQAHQTRPNTPKPHPRSTATAQTCEIMVV